MGAVSDLRHAHLNANDSHLRECPAREWQTQKSQRLESKRWQSWPDNHDAGRLHQRRAVTFYSTVILASPVLNNVALSAL